MLNLDEREVPPHKQVLFKSLMVGPDKPVYVLGRNKFAQRVNRSLEVHSFVDDFTSEKSYLGKPVIRMIDLPRECIVISCVVDTIPVTALNKLQSAGVHAVIDYFSLSRMDTKAFGEMDCCHGNREDILKNADKYEWVYNRLADDVSKEHFAKVVRFRMSMDLEHMHGFSLAIDKQYFESFLPMKDGAVFVDGGGYDGQNTLQFAGWNKNYRNIHYFEPTPGLMELSRDKLSGLRNVRFVQKGLFSRSDRLCFNAEAGLANSLSPTGQTEIEVVRLDDEVQEPVTLLKLDIEGAEFEAIQGAAEHIRSATPTLAVCIYHDQQDFWRIPQRVFEINDRYNLFVRHYTESVRETVMFFVPKNT